MDEKMKPNKELSSMIKEIKRDKTEIISYKDKKYIYVIQLKPADGTLKFSLPLELNGKLLSIDVWDDKIILYLKKGDSE